MTTFPGSAAPYLAFLLGLLLLFGLRGNCECFHTMNGFPPVRVLAADQLGVLGAVLNATLYALARGAIEWL
jgi:hypothetical protein